MLIFTSLASMPFSNAFFDSSRGALVSLVLTVRYLVHMPDVTGRNVVLQPGPGVGYSWQPGPGMGHSTPSCVWNLMCVALHPRDL